jgi:PhzF family phenazine biosynthesis protein
MRIPIWQVDAFTDRVFAGNPAAICVLEQPLPDRTLAAIAAENNLSETAFLRPEGDGFAIRWFTPTIEVDLCGHATLASAHVVFRHLAPDRPSVTFRSASGPLKVTRLEDGLLEMTFPRRPPHPAPPPAALIRAIGREPVETQRERDYYAVLESEEQVRSLVPDLAAVAQLPGHGLVVTAPASTPGCDFASRFFAPQAGIPEDPVTGSVHCTLTPYWAARLGRPRLEALQVSARGGRLRLEDRPGAVAIAGRTAEYLAGAIEV